MKLSLSYLLKSRPHFGYRKGLTHLLSSTSTLTTLSRPDRLYKRISPVGDHSISIVPVLDQWVREGRTVDKRELQLIIKELRLYKRFKHALEWMTDKRYIPPASDDIATRLNLICKVHGLEQAENYFNNIPQQVKGFEVYNALLNCYMHVKSVQKAEGVMQKLRDLGYTRTPFSYNILMNLYYRIGKWEKLDTIMHEMEEKGIRFDIYTLTIRLSAYAAASDIDGIDKIVAIMESTPGIVLDCDTYAVATNGYLKVGSVDKALKMLIKLERLMSTSKRRNVAFDNLLGLYGETGKKDEVYRIWDLYKKEMKIFNKGYTNMISSLLKCDDIEGAEKVFEEWELRGLSYDFRIPNLLIGAYCKNGELGKAEVLLNRGISKGGNPVFDTWFYLAGVYIEYNQIPKAVEMLKNAISECNPNWRPSKDTLVMCLKYLEQQGDVEEAEEFIQLLKEEGIFSGSVHESLLNFIKDGKSVQML